MASSDFFEFSAFDAYLRNAWESDELVVGRHVVGGQLALFGSPVASMHACRIYGDDFDGDSSPLQRGWREGRLLLHSDDSLTVLELPHPCRRERLARGGAGAPMCLLKSITYVPVHALHDVTSGKGARPPPGPTAPPTTM